MIAVTAGGDVTVLLVEGRLVLIIAVVMLALAAASLRCTRAGRAEAARPVAIAGVATGFVMTAIAMLVAIGHPVDLATLVHNFGDVPGGRVTVPNGPGVWMAVAGGSVVLLAGSLMLGGRQWLAAAHGASAEVGTDDDSYVAVSSEAPTWDAVDDGFTGFGS